MRRSILAVAVLALMLSVGGVFADGGGSGGGQGGQGGGGGQGGQGGEGGSSHSDGSYSNSGHNRLYNDQDQKQGQIQLQGQLQGQKQSADNKGNTQSASNAVTQNYAAQSQLHYSGEYTVKSAPGFALGGPASGPCNGFSGGIAGSGIGFGFAANTSTVDKGCEDRETARMFQQLGDTATGIEILKNTDSYKRLVESKAAKKAEDDATAAKKAEAAPAPGSWTSGPQTDSSGSQPVRTWTGNSELQPVAFTSSPR